MSAILFFAGRAATLFLPKRDHPEDDDFEFAVVVGGKEFKSTAPALRAGWALTVMGGLDMDLRDATLAPAGADLRLNTVMGGLRVLVPDTWRVEVQSSVSGGNVDVQVADVEHLPDDAPTLRIALTAKMAGVLVTTDPDAEAVVAMKV